MPHNHSQIRLESCLQVLVGWPLSNAGNAADMKISSIFLGRFSRILQAEELSVLTYYIFNARGVWFLRIQYLRGHRIALSVLLKEQR